MHRSVSGFNQTGSFVRSYQYPPEIMGLSRKFLHDKKGISWEYAGLKPPIPNQTGLMNEPRPFA